VLTGKIIERLSAYRQILNRLDAKGKQNVYSHQIAEAVGVKATQVRRDLMSLGFTGSPARGYEVTGLLDCIRQALDKPGGQELALIGAGQLGQAVIGYFNGPKRNLRIVAAFDSNSAKTGRVINGCRCHPMEELEKVIRENEIEVGIISVPAAAAQGIATRLVRAGIGGILNFAPVHLQVPEHVYLYSVDISVSLEKVAFFARQEKMQKEPD